MAKNFLVHLWMMKDLGLSGNELVAYAYLYEVTKRGKEVFTGGYAELTSAMNCTIPTVYNTIKKLRDKRLVMPEGGMDAIIMRSTNVKKA